MGRRKRHFEAVFLLAIVIVVIIVFGFVRTVTPAWEFTPAPQLPPYPSPSSSTIGGALMWNKTYGGENQESARSVIQTTDGGYALAGCTRSYGAGDYDFWLVKTDSAGNKQWNKTYGGAYSDSAYGVVQTSDGGYALAGGTESSGAGASDFWLVKTDASGTIQWSQTYGGTDWEVAYSLVQTSDGGYAIAGIAGSYDFWLVKTDSAGSRQWSKAYGGQDYEVAYSLVQTSDGGFALAGYTSSYGAGSNDFWLVKTNSAGRMLWSQTYGGEYWDVAYSLLATSDGGYAIAGCTESDGAGVYDFWLVKTDSAGNALWNKTYGGESYEEAYCVVQTVDGGYALAGYTLSYGAGGYDFWLVKTDTAGSKLWNRTYGKGNYEEAYSVAETNEGGLAIAGYTYSFGTGLDDFWFVKVSGEILIGDANIDKKVDLFDLFLLGMTYDSTPSSPNWNLNCDFNADNRIDASDLHDLSENYGKTD